MLNIGEEQIQVSESDAAEKPSVTSAGPKRKEIAFAFSKHFGSNYTITQTADSIEYEHYKECLANFEVYFKLEDLIEV